MPNLETILSWRDSEIPSRIPKYLPCEGEWTYIRDSSDIFGIFYKPPRISPKVVLVAHMDTVRKESDYPLQIEKDNFIWRNSNGILGADDRAGIYIILRVLQKVQFPCLITNFEEQGLLGVKKILVRPEWDRLLSRASLFIGLDLPGDQGPVCYDEFSLDTLGPILEDLGLKIKYRKSSTDVKLLTEVLGIPHINMPVGYKNQHSKEETLDILCVARRIYDLIRLWKPLGNLFGWRDWGKVSLPPEY